VTDWKDRLVGTLEPALSQPDPRELISAYHDMPYAVFRYPPEAELAVRQETALLVTRLQHAGKRVTIVSLAECLAEALASAGVTIEQLADAERTVGLDLVIDTIHAVLDGDPPLDALVARRLPADADPLRDVVLIVRAGALFPCYRTSSLLEQLKGQVHVPAVLFYPGVLDGIGLRFMGVLAPEHNYRPKIF